jgi:hypothetical protein
MQHRIYWGPLKEPLEWSLKTWLAPWSYVSSVVFHDLYWYPFKARGRVQEALQSDWGRLFHNWERLLPDERGFAELGPPPPGFPRRKREMLRMGARVLGTAVRESPEVASRLRHRRWGG